MTGTRRLSFHPLSSQERGQGERSAYRPILLHDNADIDGLFF